MSLILSTGINSLVPLSVTYVATRTLVPDDAAGITVALAVTAYVAQVLGAMLVETHLLGSVRSSKPAIPAIFIVAALAGYVSCLFGTVSPWLWVLGYVPLGALGEVCRVLSILNRKVAVEAVGASLLSIVMVFSYFQPSTASLYYLLPTAVLALAFARCWGLVSRGVARLPRGSVWVVSEAAATGITQPTIAIILFFFMGPEQAIAYRMISSVVNLFSPILSFVRIRLLDRDSYGDKALGLALCIAAGATVMMFQFGDLWVLLFGAAWSGVSAMALMWASLWRGCSLLTTIPYAELRRNGRPRDVFNLRLMSTCIYLPIAIVGVLVAGTKGVFLCYLVGEAISWRIYASRSARLRSESFLQPLAETKQSSG
ncbi:hypothetical protein [Rhodococcus koreensis]